MAAGKDTIYIKADASVEVTKRDVTLGDLVQMECANEAVIPKLKTLKVEKFPSENREHSHHGKSRKVISILKVISCIHSEYPGLDVQNMGAQDIIVTYEDQETPSAFLHWMKVVAVVLITASGAAFSIMSFNNDVNTTKLFDQIYALATGHTSDGFTILEVTYSIGITIGILVFFNHFGRKRFSVDPTPLEVEMRLYENDIQTTLVETYARKGKETDAGNTDFTGDPRS